MGSTGGVPRAPAPARNAFSIDETPRVDDGNCNQTMATADGNGAGGVALALAYDAVGLRTQRLGLLEAKRRGCRASCASHRRA